MTDQARTQIVRKLDEFFHRGHDPVRVLNESIANGWKGVFEPKASQGTQFSKPPEGRTTRTISAAQRAIQRIEARRTADHYSPDDDSRFNLEAGECR